MYKKLAFKMPPVYGVLIHGFYLSILPNNDKIRAWFHTNYIQLRFINNFGLHYIHYLEFCDSVRNCPFIEEIIVPSEDIVNCKNNTHNFFIENINKNLCVRIFLDEFYMKTRSSYNNYRFIHDVMVHGYDTDKKSIITALV